jgi:hypothetical protein
MSRDVGTDYALTVNGTETPVSSTVITIKFESVLYDGNMGVFEKVS